MFASFRRIRVELDVRIAAVASRRVELRVKLAVREMNGPDGADLEAVAREHVCSFDVSDPLLRIFIELLVVVLAQAVCGGGALATGQPPLAASRAEGLGAAGEGQAHVKTALLVVTRRAAALASVVGVTLARYVALPAAREAYLLEHAIAGLVHPAAQQTRLELPLLHALGCGVAHFTAVETLLVWIRVLELPASFEPPFFSSPSIRFALFVHFFYDTVVVVLVLIV